MRQRARQRIEVGGLLADRVEQRVGEIHREAVPHDDALHRLIGEVVGHRVGRHEPAAHAQPIREVEERPVLRVSRAQPPGEHGDRAAVAHELERCHRCDPAREVNRDPLR
ncbi:hypothetical protein, partial [Leucobacter chromiireducens]|uniref:hypothetical protein n=1 Tax=Leucobacter chromiireducens TaxID=283877 RepID=UPI0019CFD2A7